MSICQSKGGETASLKNVWFESLSMSFFTCSILFAESEGQADHQEENIFLEFLLPSSVCEQIRWNKEKSIEHRRISFGATN